MTTKLPIHTKGVTFTEIPNQMVAFFEVGNCTMKCRGCHSQHLWGDKDAHYMGVEDFLEYANKEMVQGILLMGGYTNGIAKDEVLENIIKPLSEHYPIGMYHGGDSLDLKYAQPLEWLKVGSYIEHKGGLDKPTTNQRFYKRDASGQLVDATEVFQKKGD